MAVGLSNAERQRRNRERLKSGQPPSCVRYLRPKDRHSTYANSLATDGAIRVRAVNEESDGSV